MSESRGISLPGAPAQTPGLPENFTPIAFEIFETLNTKTPRPGIKDSECSWMDGIMPIGPNNARTLPGTGPIINTNIAATWVWIGFGNIINSQFCYAVTSDGRLIQIDLATLAVKTLLGAGGIVAPSSIMGMAQWGSQYIIFTKDQSNGYWLWDAANLYTAGTIGPIISVNASGSGYTTPPGFTITTTGSGSGVTLGASLENGSVSNVVVLTPGTGFGPGDFISIAASSAAGADTQAYANPPSPSTTTGGLQEVYVITGGSGYTADTHAVVSGSGTGATISLAIQNGTITGAAIVTAGSGYSSVSISIVDSGGGIGGAIGANLNTGQITSIPITFGGSGYVTPPLVTIRGDGVDAAGVATISGGVVTAITMTDFGNGYTKAVVDLTGGNNAADVSGQLMPFGVSGTWAEVYEGHVWVGNGAAVADFPPLSRVIFSAPDSPVDFGDGGGAFLSNDPFLRVGYHAGKQANGFLYLIGDSSMNYISGVQTTTPSGSTVTPVPTTTFGNLNVDPQIGAPWPSSVQVFSRNIVEGNTVGIYVSYGGAVRKVSDPLDGFYAFGPIFARNGNFSAAVAHIFGIPVYMLLLPVPTLNLSTGQFTGPVVNKLLMWDGNKWFTSQQDQSLIYIATLEINSVLTAYGTDGTNIFPLFSQAQTGFQKVIQSKLYSAPMYASTKQSRSLSGIINFYASDAAVTITIDSEGGQGTGNASVTITPGPSFVTIMANGETTDWTPPGWTGTGLVVFGPIPVAQQGRLIGMTMQTNASDVALLSLFLADMAESPNV